MPRRCREPLRDEFHETLDRLIVATQLRYAVVGELARSVRFRVFDQPVIDESSQAGARRRTRAAALPRRPSRCPRPRRAHRGSRRQPGAAHSAACGAHRRAGGPRAAARAPHAPLLQDLRARGRALVAPRRTAVRHRPLLARRPAPPADHHARRGLGVARGRLGRRRAGIRCPRPGVRRRLLPALERGAARRRQHGRRAQRSRQRGGAAPDGAEGDCGRERSGWCPRAPLHLPPGRRGVSRGARHPRSAPDDRAAPPSLAARQLRRHAPAGGRGRPPLPLRRPREPVR